MYHLAKMKLQEAFMRIDIFLSKTGELYVNEVEPWKSRKVCMIRDCSLSPRLHLDWLQISNRDTQMNMTNLTIYEALKYTCFLYVNRDTDVELQTN